MIVIVIILTIGQTEAMFPCLMVNSIPVNEIEELTITGLNLKCASGCSLMSITSIACLSTNEAEQEAAMSSVYLSDKLYNCTPTPMLPANYELNVNSIDCKYCDKSDRMVVQDTCSLNYELRKEHRTNWYDIMMAFVLSIVLFFLLAMLYKEVHGNNPSRLKVEEWSIPVGRGDINTCEKKGGMVEDRRDEVLFKQGHSLLGGKRRGRSRSRRRIKNENIEN